MLLGSLLAPGARVAGARPLEVPTFPVDPGEEVAGLHVAAGTDGTMVFLWHAAGTVRDQLYSATGAALGAPVTIGNGSQVRISADTLGGYVAAFTRVTGGHLHLFARRLDHDGQPAGAELQVDPADPLDIALPQVVTLPSGPAFVWQQGSEARARLYDPAGAPRGAAFVVGENGFGFPLAAAALADGGLVVVWHDPSVHTFLGRIYAGDGTPRVGPQFLASFPLDVRAIAGSPAGGFAAAGIGGSSGVRVARFTDDLALVAQVDVQPLPVNDPPAPTIAVDGAGNWHVVWGGARYDPTAPGQLLGYQAPRARPLADDLAPLEPSFALSDVPAPEVSTALLPSGSFVNAWSSATTPGDARGYANVVSLCTPGSHVCGDGVLDPRCEECDDGAANSDITPNACRTSCRLAACGDGALDSGEACDDGDPSPCDGCDDTCQPVAGLACGDGILVPGCTDQCDDGNAVEGDGCAPQCTLERVPGGGSATTDCYSEWSVNNPTNVPLRDRRSGINRKQRCVDNDPQCDFDGGTPGRCTFRVRVCVDNTDVAGCTPPGQLAGWGLTRPSAAQVAAHPDLAPVRAAFVGVQTAVLTATAPDTCTAFVDVVVPMRGASAPHPPGKLTLKATAATADGTSDKDGLRLACVPAS